MAQHLDVSTTELITGISSRNTLARRVVAAGLGALVVAAAAQVSVPVPFSPVPMTLQPLAVLVVGGLLGAAAGAGALATYLAMGVLGVPVFAGALAGVPGGIPRLMGPTGGYLLSYPIVAAITGALVTSALNHEGMQRTIQIFFACVIGMVIVHVGGAAQLAAITGSAAGAFRMGFVPFVTGDLVKVGLAALVILVAGPRVRSWL